MSCIKILIAFSNVKKQFAEADFVTLHFADKSYNLPQNATWTLHCINVDYGTAKASNKLIIGFQLYSQFFVGQYTF